MVKLSCPIPGCVWESNDFPPEFAVVANTTLETHIRYVHPQNEPQPVAPNPPKPVLKLKPLHISAGSTPDQWSAFKRQWSMYKTGMCIPTAVHATALFHCCDDDLMTDLMRDIQGDMAAMPESDLLAAIKRLAVKEESTLVHRIRLGKMTQAPGMPIRTFLANLKGQAALCQYVATCKENGCDHVYD